MPGLGRKVFTAGDVLTASDVQNYLMDQSVMVFAGTAARSSAIATPTDGMVSYNQTNNSLEAYNGSEWINTSGLQLVKTQTVGTGVSSVSVSSAFSATYQNYKILYSNGVASTVNDLLLTLNGITTGYWTSLIYSGFNSVGLAAAKSENAANFSWTGCGTSANTLVEIDIQNPFLAKTKMMNATYNTMNVPSGNIGRTHGFINSTTSATAFTLTTNTGTITGGTIYVYGYGT
jgi:hypothetical protein